MLLRLVRHAYRVLGPRYRFVLLTGEAWASVAVALATVFLTSRFFEGLTVAQVAVVMAAAAVLTSVSVAYAVLHTGAALVSIETWRSTPLPTPKETVAAWELATTFTLRQFRRDSLGVSLVAVVPTSLLATLVWDIGWAGLGAMLLASLIPAVYATVLSYSVGEVLARPLIEEIATELPADFVFEPHGLPLAKRLRISLPAYTTCSGIAVASIVGGGGGAERLALVVVVALVIGVLLSTELSAFLSSSITGPLADVRRGLERVRAGQYDERVPVLSSDEVGELAHDFNRMASGLAEREELREAFGTYVDRDVAQLILSGQFPVEGVEVDVSLLFCDVRDFTAYAENAAATEVIATLNALFSEIVPIVEAFGGHVDKFLGDGLLAVFGAPEVQPDHADRAVDAARMIVDAVRLGTSGLCVGAGVNSGRVVAGPLGGAGRLNFSVIGDAVNVAARVEAATRETGDDVLITAATREMLVRPQALVSRGELPLKGKTAPVELFALMPQESQSGSRSARSATS